jgi:peptidoglycan/xylan/chitin deacetylase (PgdA/CDA1 family)
MRDLVSQGVVLDGESAYPAVSIVDPDAAPGARRAVVLMYHGIAQPENDWEARLFATPERFAAHMRALARQGLHACSLDDFTAWLAGDSALSPGSFLLTFDDGFAGVHEHAFPILADLGWPATIFLVSTQIGKHDAWCCDENPSGKTHRLMDRMEIRAMSACGFSFQSHSRSHPFLTALSPECLDRELSGSRAELEDLLGRPVDYLAYPYGRVDQRVMDATRNAGYRGAFSCKAGFNRCGVDPFRLRRVEAYGDDTPTMLVRKAVHASNVGSLAQALTYYPPHVLSSLRQRLLG